MTDAPADPHSTHPALHHALVVFQAERLRRTYADFVASDRFGRMAEFFFSDVYSAKDPTERDTQFKQVYQFFRRSLGEALVHGLGELVELNDLSHTLDLELVVALQARVRGDTFGEDEYEEAYRRCDNYDVRVRQIEMLCRSIRYFRSLAERWSIGLVLKTVKATAAVLGGHTLIGFLDRGYGACRSVTTEENGRFVETVGARERARLDRIYRRPGWKNGGRW